MTVWFRGLQQKMAGISPGHLFSDFATPYRGGAVPGGGGRQRCRSAVEQRRDAADSDAPG